MSGYLVLTELFGPSRGGTAVWFAEVYARLGYFRGEISASGAGLRVSSTGSDFSYGLGAAFNVSKDTAITLDYTVFYDKSSITVNGFGVGLRFNF